MILRISVTLILLLSGAVSSADEMIPPSMLLAQSDTSQDVDENADNTEPSPQYLSLDSLFTLYQPYLDNISAYQPIYFLVGTDPGESKFQFSFKYRIFDIDSDKESPLRLLEGVHFAYTQTSYWDLASSSLPFEDTSYKPELFFITPNIDPGLAQTSGLFVQSGIQHESNGQGGDDSRSTNFLYIRPMFITYNQNSSFGFLVSPKIWAYVDNADDTNKDLPDYKGYFDLELKFGLAESLVVGSNFSWAKEGGSMQVDVTYPMDHIFPGISGVYLHLEYVNKLAESLLNYDERTEAFRVGLSIIR